jgi:hypothetical protein
MPILLEAEIQFSSKKNGSLYQAVTRDVKYRAL